MNVIYMEFKIELVSKNISSIIKVMWAETLLETDYLRVILTTLIKSVQVCTW